VNPKTPLSPVAGDGAGQVPVQGLLQLHFCFAFQAFAQPNAAGWPRTHCSALVERTYVMISQTRLTKLDCSLFYFEV